MTSWFNPGAGAADGFTPVFIERSPAGGIHSGLEHFVDLSGFSEAFGRPHTEASSGKVGGSEGCGFDICGALNGDAQHICLKLHQVVIGGGSAIDFQNGE